VAADTHLGLRQQRETFWRIPLRLALRQAIQRAGLDTDIAGNTFFDHHPRAEPLRAFDQQAHSPFFIHDRGGRAHPPASAAVDTNMGLDQMLLPTRYDWNCRNRAYPRASRAASTGVNDGMRHQKLRDIVKISSISMDLPLKQPSLIQR
jgi:hypothetical protein